MHCQRKPGKWASKTPENLVGFGIGGDQWRRDRIALFGELPAISCWWRMDESFRYYLAV